MSAPDWFHNAVVSGVQRLAVLSLPGTPAAEVLPLATHAWIDTLWLAPVDWDELRDTQRLADMFQRVGLVAERWPSPRTLLEHLPARAPVVRLAPPRSEPSASVREQLSALMRRRRTDVEA